MERVIMMTVWVRRSYGKILIFVTLSLGPMTLS